MKTFFTLLTILALLLAFNTSQATIHNVSVVDYSFSPMSFTAVVGDTVLWTVDETAGVPHTTTSEAIPAGATAWDNPFSGTAGQTFMYVIQVAGTYNYQCNYHVSMGMIGSFTVTGTTTGVNSISSNDIAHLSIPTPFTGSVVVNYDKAGVVVVYNLLGESVAAINVGGANQGEISISSLPSGMYVVALVSNGAIIEKRMVMKNN